MSPFFPSDSYETSQRYFALLLVTERTLIFLLNIFSRASASSFFRVWHFEQSWFFTGKENAFLTGTIKRSAIIYTVILCISHLGEFIHITTNSFACAYRNGN